ncbi:MAG: argininosuccinate lyase, partial [Oscillospiraceae bacterium]
IGATDCADYLVKKGLPFRDAYKAVGGLVAKCIETDRTLETLPIAEYRQVCALFDEDVYAAISLDTCVRERKVAGGPAPETVAAHIQSVRAQLAD